MESEDKEFFDTQTMCTEFWIAYKKTHKHTLDPGFEAQVKGSTAVPFEDCEGPMSRCPKAYQNYMKAMRYFGTHWITWVEMGAKRIHRLEISRKEVI